MIIDHQAPDPTFVTGPMPPVDLDEMMEWARAQLGLGADRPWKLISARRKLGKPLFEIEEETPEGPQRIIGKVARPSRGETLFAALKLLWDSGFRPPNEFTVVRPIAYLPERNLIFQERAPGTELLQKMMEGAADTMESARKAGRWLAALHGSRIPAKPWREPVDRSVEWANELAEKTPWAAERIRSLDAACRQFLSGRKDEDMVPAHGDFHPMNIFIADSGRLTAIDIDKFGLRERANEVGYCLGQTGFMCHVRLGSIAASRELREVFLAEYEKVTGVSMDRQALGGYMAATVIKNLHFTLVAYEERRSELVDPWLDAAEQCLRGNIDIT
jgi:hypothetical protein